MACGDEGIDFDSDSDFDPDKPSTPRTLNNVVSYKVSNCLKAYGWIYLSMASSCLKTLVG